MFGYRPDGRRISNIDPIVRITPYLMPMRCDAQVFLQHKVDYEKLARYIAAQRMKDEQITFMNIIVAAYVRAVSQHPEVNRFIMTKQYYSRNNCTVSYTMLKGPQSAEDGETAVKIHFDLTDTIYDVRDRMSAAINATAVWSRRTLRISWQGGHGRARLADAGGRSGASAGSLRLVPRRVAGRAALPHGHVHHQQRLHRFASCEPPHLQFWQHQPVLRHGYGGAYRGAGQRGQAEDEASAAYRHHGRRARLLRAAYYAGFFATMSAALNDPASLEVPPESVRFDPHAEYHVPKLHETAAQGATVQG